MMNLLIVLGSGFDKDLGLENSFAEFSKCHLNPACGNAGWGAFENTLRQKVIDWYKNGMDDNSAKEINRLWQIYKRNLSYFFTIKSDVFCLDVNSCAHKFLESLSKNYNIYSFNYTNPYDYVKLDKEYPITHLHGRYYKDTFKKDMMVVSQGSNLVIGIDDDCIPCDTTISPYIQALIKTHQQGYVESNLKTDLLFAETIILYGFSMCEVDYTIYFKGLFNTIAEGRALCKKIFYITACEDSYAEFREKLNEFDNKNMSLDAKVKIIPIYTTLGYQNKTFRKLLNIL